MNPAEPQTLQLRDIHLPAEPGFWPPAPGWWLVAAMVFALLVWVGMKSREYYRIHRQRQRILRVLEQLESASGQSETPVFLAQISMLLRRLALMRFPRKDIAALTGDAWLEFLDSSGGNGQFCRGAGRVLADGPYVRDIRDSVDSRALGSLIRTWIKKNSGA